jgi:hypothetical protein
MKFNAAEDIPSQAHCEGSGAFFSEVVILIDKWEFLVGNQITTICKDVKNSEGFRQVIH